MALLRRPSRFAWRITLYSLAALFVALLAILARITYQGLIVPRSVPARAARTIPNTDVNPYGANFFLDREVESWKRDRTLYMASQAGIGWVKQQFSWEEIEPKRKGEYLSPSKGDSWAKYDEIVAACEKYGLQIVARLDRPPDWARQDNVYQEAPPDDLDDYGDFVYAFVRHYEGRISYIQIWNEPNIFPEWGNRPVDPAGYVRLLEVAYRRAKEANPNVHVLSAPLAITLGEPGDQQGTWRAMSDLQFLEEMYRAGAKGYFDIFSANAFGMERPPEDPPDPNVLNFQRVLLQRQIMERYGDQNTAVWFDEYGWNAAPESFPKSILAWQRVSEKQQAENTLHGIEMARRDWPWAGVFMIWYFRQVGSIPEDQPSYYFRMVDTDFTPRLLYLAVQDAAHLEQVAGPGLYQETNPGVRTYGSWRTVIDASASGGSFIRSDKPGDSITFAFRGTGIDLLTRQASAAGTLLVWLDGHPVAGLATNGQGLSYVDLYSQLAQVPVRVPLVRRAALGDHTLRITVAADRHPDSSGQECVLNAFEVLQDSTPLFPPYLVGGCAAGLALVGWLLWRTWRRVRWIV